MPRLIIESPEFAGVCYDLQGESITVGRTNQNMIHIEHPSVSSRHAEFRYEDGDYRLVDNNSTNGSRVNDERISEVVLRNQDIVMLGHIILRYESENVLAAPPLPEMDLVMDFGNKTGKARPDMFVNLGPFPKSTKNAPALPLVLTIGLVLYLVGFGYMAFSFLTKL